jgi:hypothetical protein
MSSNNQPLSNTSFTPFINPSLNSLLSTVILDQDTGVSSCLVRTGGKNSLYIDSYSNVGINTTSPSFNLDINSTNGNCLKLLYNNTANSTFTVNTNGVLTISTSGNSIITNSNFNINNHNGSTTGLYLNNNLVLANATQLNYTVVVPGTATANKSLVLDLSLNITGINSLSASSLTGTLQTAIQPNITSLGTLSGLSVTGNLSISGSLVIAGSAFDVTAIGYVAGVTPGTAAASKAIVLDTGLNIIGINSLSSSTLIGTLSTPTQTNITSIGTLTSLTVSGLVSFTSLVDSTSITSGTLTVSGGLGVAKTLYVGTGIYGTLQTASQTNITSIGTLSGLNVSGSVTFTNNVNSTSTTNAPLVITGGVGIGQDLYVGGNAVISGDLFINGNRTAIASSYLSFKDNTILLNAGPSGSGNDSGFLVQRYQVDNNTGSGDVTTNTPAYSINIASATTNTITFNSDVSAISGYYNNWWIKITSGSGNNQVRQISSYNGSTFIATLTSPLTTVPVSGTTINLYNKAFATFVWQEGSKSFVTGYVVNNNASTEVLMGYADISVGNTIINSTTNSTSSTTGALTLSGGIGISNTTDASSSSNGGAITIAGGLAVAKSVYVGTTLNIGNNQLTQTGVGYLTSIVPGTASTGKAMVLDGSLNIMGINQLTASTLIGTLSTASQPNITSVGTLSNLTIAGNLTVGSTTVTTNILGYLSNITAGTGTASKALVLDINNNITNINQLTVTNLIGSISTPSQTAITTVGTLSSLNVNGVVNLYSATDSSSSVTGSTIIAGGVGIAKSVYIGGNLNVTNNVTASNIYGTISTSSQPNITSHGVLTSLSSSGAVTFTSNTTSTSIGTGTLVVTGGVGISGALFIGGSLNVGSTSISSTQLGYLSGISLGNVTGSKVVSADSSLNISGVNVLGVAAITLNGTDLATTLNNLATTIATNSPIALQGVTAGTATASKALIVDSAKSITSINSLTATTLTASNIYGTLQSAAQTNITTVGVLTGLSVTSGNDSVVITNTAVSGNANVRFVNDNRGYQFGIKGSSAVAGSTNGLYIYDETNAAYRMVLTASGLFGFGTTSPSKTVDIAGSLNATSYFLNGSSVNVLALVGVNPGTASLSKALVLDGSLNITGINALTSTYLYGTISTPIQTGITQVGTLTSLSVSGIVTLSSSTDATSSTAGGALTITGGAAIGATLYVGTGIYGTLRVANQSYITQVGTLLALNVSGAVTISLSTDASSSTAGGALTISGGAAVGQSLYVGTGIYGSIKTASQTSITQVGTLTGLSSSGAVTFTSGITSSSISTGTLVVTGGIGVSGNLYIGGNNVITGNLSATNISGTLTTTSQTAITSVGILTSLSSSGSVTFTGGTASTNTTSGTLIVTGGTGISGNLYVGGNNVITGNLSATNISGVLTTAAQTAITSVGILTSLSSSGSVTFTGGIASTNTTSGTLVVTGGTGISGNLYVGGSINGTLAYGVQTGITQVGTLSGLTSSGTVSVTNNTQSTSSSSGALVVTGGVGIGGNLNIQGNVVITGTFSGNLGNANLSSVTQLGLTGSLSSTALTNWNAQSVGFSKSWQSIVWSPELGLFVAIATDTTSPIGSIMTSPDGINWTARNTAASKTYNNICWSSDLNIFVAVGNDSISPYTSNITTSVDGINWTTRTGLANITFNDVCWANGLNLFVAVGYLGGSTSLVATSPDGINWTSRSVPSTQNWISVAWSKELGILVITSSTTGVNNIAYSYNGINWTACSTPNASYGYNNITWSKPLGIFVTLSSAATSAYGLYSSNGINWTSMGSSIPTPTNYYSNIIWIDELSTFVASQFNSSNFIYSTNGTSWITVSTSNVGNWISLAWSSELGLLAVISSSSSSSNQVITTTQVASSFLNLVSNNQYNNTSNIGVSADTKLSLKSGLYGSTRWTNTTLSSSSNELMRLTKDGFLGINKFTPRYNLDVGGVARVNNLITNGTLNNVALQSWNQVYNYPATSYINAVCWSPDLKTLVITTNAFTAGTVTNTILYSTNYGVTWSSSNSVAQYNWVSICWAPELGIFVACNSTGASASNAFMYSSNGINWTGSNGPSSNGWNSICWSSELQLFVAVSNATSSSTNSIAYSSNGINWSGSNSVSASNWNSIAWSPQLQLFVAVANASSSVTNTFMTSSDGINWTGLNSPSTNNWSSICWSPQLLKFVVVSNSPSSFTNTVCYSSNGTTWTSVNSAVSKNWGNVIWCDELGIFVAIAKESSAVVNSIMYSSDAINWTLGPNISVSNCSWNGICWCPEIGTLFTCGSVGSAGIIIYSNQKTLNNFTLVSNNQAYNQSQININAATSLTYQTGLYGKHIWNNYQSATNSNNEVMRISSSGNLGINKRNPLVSLDVGGASRSKQVLIGPASFIVDIADSTTLLSLLDNTMTNASYRYLKLGSSNSNNNRAEIAFYYNSSGSTSNAIRFGFSGQTQSSRFCYTAQGYVGINNISPAYNLDVTGSINSSNTIYATTGFSGPILTASQTIINQVGTLLNLTVGTSSSSATALTINNTTQSTSYLTGSVVISGGVGIAGNVYVNGTINGAVALSGSVSSSAIVSITNSTIASSGGTGALVVTGGIYSGSGFYGTILQASQTSITQVGTLNTLTVGTSSSVVIALSINNTTASSSYQTGAVVIAGGVGIAGNVYVNGSINGNHYGTIYTASQPNITQVGTLSGLTSSGIVSVTNNTQSTASSSGALVVTGGVGIGGAVNITGAVNIGGNVTFSSNTSSLNTTTGAVIISGGLGIGGALNVNNNIATNGSIKAFVNVASSSTSTGSIVSNGGLGVAGNIYAGGTLNVTGNSSLTGTLTVGSTTTITGSLCLGNSTDTSRMISALNSSMATNTNTYITLGKSNDLNDQAEISFTYVGPGSGLNQLNFGFYGGVAMTLLANGNLGINCIPNNAYNLDVNGNTRINGWLTLNRLIFNSNGAANNTVSILNNDLGNWEVGTRGSMSGITAANGGSYYIYNNISTSSVSGQIAMVINYTNNYIGFNNTNPSYHLDIGGGTVNAATYLGTLGTASQPNITQVGTLSNLTVGTGSSSTNAVTVTNTTTSSSVSTGALVVAGGVGIGGNLNVSGIITGTITPSVLSLPGTTDATSSTIGGTLTVSGGGAFAKSVWIGTNLNLVGSTSTLIISGTTGSTSSTTGAIQCVGGAYFGSSCLYAGLITSSLSTSSTSNITGSLLLAGGIGISNTTDATSSTNGGTITTAGGAAFAKSVWVGTNVTLSNTTSTLIIAGTAGSTSSTTGALQCVGGSYFGGNCLYAGLITSSLSTASTSNSTGAILLAGGLGISNTTDATSAINGGTITTAGGAAFAKSVYIGTNLTLSGTTSNLTLSGTSATLNLSGTSSTLTISGTTASSSSTTGAVVITGGVGIGGNISIGGNITVTGSCAFSNSITASLTTSSTSNSTGVLLIAGGIGISNATDATSAINGGTITTAGGAAFAKSVWIGTNLTLSGSSSNLNLSGTSSTLTISGTTTSSSSTTGAVVIAGGVGIGGNTFIGSNTLAGLSQTGSLVLSGGINISKNIYIGGSFSTSPWGLNGVQYCSVATNYFDNTSSGGTVTNAVITSFAKPTISTTISTTPTIFTNVSTVYIADSPNAGTNVSFTNAYALWIASGRVFIGSNITSSSYTTGALVITGGVGIGGALNVNGVITTANNINIFATTVSTSSTTGALTVNGGMGIGGNIFTGGNLTITGTLSGVTTLSASGQTTLTAGTASTSTITGTLVVTGGVGISGTLSVNAINVTGNGANLSVNASSSSVGSLSFNNDSGNWEMGTRGSANTLGITAGKYFYLSNNITGSASVGTFALAINPANNYVSINNTAPSTYNFDVGATGSIRSGSYVVNTGGLVLNGAPSDTTYQIDFGTASYNYALQINLCNGSRGFGVGNPSGYVDMYTENGYSFRTTFITGASKNAVISGDSNSAPNTTEIMKLSTTDKGGYLSFGINAGTSAASKTTTSGICLNDNNIYIRGSNLTDTNHYIGYSGTGNDGVLIVGNTSVVIGTTIGASGGGALVNSKMSSSLTEFWTQTNFYSSASSVNYTSGAVVVTGGIGIGGNVNANGSIACNGVIQCNTTTSSSFFKGWLGIGTITPNCPLHVAINNGNQVANTIGNGGTIAGFSSNNNESFQGGSSTGYNQNGNYVSSISIVGAGWIGSNVGFFAVSDIRNKTNIKDINKEFCLYYIKNVRPKSYELKQQIDLGIKNTQYGFIAQDFAHLGLIELLQESYEPDNKYLVDLVDDKGFHSPKEWQLGINYNETIPILTKTIQILYDENEELKSEVTDLKTEVNDLKTRLQNLEQIIHNLFPSTTL